MTDSPFLTVPELASLLRVKVWTVYEWTRAIGPHSVPCYQGGKRLLFDRDEALEWFRTTQRKEILSTSPGRRRRVLATARRRAPDNQSEGQQRRRAGRTRVSANGPAAVALEVPSSDG